MIPGRGLGEGEAGLAGLRGEVGCYDVAKCPQLTPWRPLQNRPRAFVALHGPIPGAKPLPLRSGSVPSDQVAAPRED